MNTCYPKPAITITEQIELLKKRGMQIDDEVDCQKFLTNVSYYRLSWYFSAYQNPNDTFIANTKFSTIKRIYILDQRLRNLIAEGIERIEVALRARIVNTTCCDYDTPLWHTANEQIQGIVKNRMRKQDRNCPFRHYDRKYYSGANQNQEYPFWVVSELCFFSDLSFIFRDALETKHKKSIAKEFRLRPHHLGSCLHTLSVLRNTVAHHDKIYKRQFSVKPNFEYLTNPAEPFHQYNYFINHYHIINHLLSVIHPNNTWKQRVDELIFEDLDIAYGYGFPSDHQS